MLCSLRWRAATARSTGLALRLGRTPSGATVEHSASDPQGPLSRPFAFQESGLLGRGPVVKLSHHDVHLAAEWLQESQGVLIAAGAGMGVDSGLPDFRGTEGLWRHYPALERAKLDLPRIANPETFRSNPRLAWGFYGHRLKLYRSTVPHLGFQIARSLEQRLRIEVGVFTSNVDGQFQKAAFNQGRLHECHGSIHWLQCSIPCSPDIWPADALEPHVSEADGLWSGPLPLCRNCGSIARPNILLFGDGDWLSDRSDMQESSLQRWLSNVRQPLVLEIGAGTAVPTVRHFARRLQSQRSAKIVRINPGDPPANDRSMLTLPTGALEALEAISLVLG